MGSKANEEAPINAITTYEGAIPAELDGAKISPM
jgi:hypothetical protein